MPFFCDKEKRVRRETEFRRTHFVLSLACFYDRNRAVAGVVAFCLGIAAFIRGDTLSGTLHIR